MIYRYLQYQQMHTSIIMYYAHAYAYAGFRVKLLCLKLYKMLIINGYKIMVVFIVYNCLLASWFLVLQTPTAF
jgi:hypothetical protein